MSGADPQEDDQRLGTCGVVMGRKAPIKVVAIDKDREGNFRTPHVFIGSWRIISETMVLDIMFYSAL